ncbi:MAG TPA: c(7)-type cytochrome triheme domain-containing protein [Candidatus Binatia bacterium]|nr:c(7)-type cytochrome triheme domain-containing protein [Candidatus Binatia bacterium]
MSVRWRFRARDAVASNWASALLAVIAIAAVTTVGCSSEARQRVLVLLFEDVPSSGEDPGAMPVVRRPRHPAHATPTPMPTVTPAANGNGAALLKTWEDVMRLLPKNHVGNPDWVAALEERVIAPQPGIARDAPEADVLALDVELVGKSDPAFTVVFSHQKHGEWLACSNCHPRLFETTHNTTPMGSADAHGERLCGACHSTVAFDVATGCPLCHLRNFPTDSDGRVDWQRAVAEKIIAPGVGPRAKSVERPILDLDVELTSKAQPSVKSVFSHRAHTQWLACANCHPRPFAADARAAGPATADWHSRRYCGACHGSVAFGITTACQRCHPGLEKTHQHEAVLDLDVTIAADSPSSTRTVFSHKTHRYLECANCHTTFFDTAAGSTKMTMADLAGGTYCATCHGKVASDLIAQCQRCHAALGDAK